jgi:molybdopterin synthase catalytic subunit
MRVRVLPFGVLKDWLGATAATIELAEGATVSDLLKRLNHGFTQPLPEAALQGIAISVNAEYTQAAHVLSEGDEVGLLPPVSGGCLSLGAPGPSHLGTGDSNSAGARMIKLTREAIDAQRLIAAAKTGEDGAVVVFDGIVRNNTRGRQTLYLDYEAYEEMALKQMQELGRQAISQFNVRHVTLVHRLGRLNVGETSVLIIVSSAHRAQAYEASRWLIDTLKQTVPIWKKETFVDGVVWAAGEPFPDSIAVAGVEAAHGG